MKYLVELSHSHLPADYILSELHLEFGRSPEVTQDPDILKLRLEDGHISVLCDYERNRVWITIHTPDEDHHQKINQRIKELLDRHRMAGKLLWSEIAVAEDDMQNE